MKLDWTFPKQILLALVTLTLLAAYPLMKFGNANFVHATIVGALLATLNVLLGYAAIEYSMDKSTTTFFKVVLGGMGLRLLFMAGLIALLIEVFDIHVGGLISSIGICYIIFLTLEILFIQKKVSIKQQS